MDPASNAEVSQLEHGLLEAARSDRIPDALRTRMAEGLGLQAAALQGSLAAGTKLGTPLFANAGLWGVLSVTLLAAITAWQVARPAPRESAAPPAQDASATPTVAPVSTAPAAVTAADIEPTPSAAKPTGESVAASTRPADDDAALRAEIALLDRARYALRDGAGERALRLLEQHRRRFQNGQLAPEARALRIEALLQRGSYAQAESMSREFAVAYPNHPLRERVAALHARAQTPRAPSSQAE
jgi:hypothetical protein